MFGGILGCPAGKTRGAVGAARKGKASSWPEDPGKANREYAFFVDVGVS
jgi:hypothetical protein